MTGNRARKRGETLDLLVVIWMRCDLDVLRLIFVVRTESRAQGALCSFCLPSSTVYFLAAVLCVREAARCPC